MRHLAAMLATVALLGACGEGGGNAEPTPSPPGERPSSPATLTIVEPAPGAEVDGDSVPVRLELEGGTIVEEVSPELTPTEGHVHLALDGETITLLGTLEEDLATLAGGPLEPGQHILEAEFVAKDHGFFIPRVTSTVTFTVR